MTAAGLFSRLRGDERGLALIEFAFSIPILALLFVGGYQSMDAMSAYRKMTTTTRALADLTTQSTSMTVGQATQILSAAQQVMAPYPTGNANALMRITQVKMLDNNGKASIEWSEQLYQGQTSAGYTKGMIVYLSPSLGGQNTYLIHSEMYYNYVPGVASSFIGTIPLHDYIFMSPRNSASVPCSDC